MAWPQHGPLPSLWDVLAADLPPHGPAHTHHWDRAEERGAGANNHGWRPRPVIAQLPPLLVPATEAWGRLENVADPWWRACDGAAHRSEEPALAPSAHTNLPRANEESPEPAANPVPPGPQERFRCGHLGCGSTFRERKSLVRHARTHTGERPYACPFDGCDSAFSELGNLTRHKRLHTGERPFKCPHPECDKTFVSSCHLRRHEVVHNKPASFVCERCGKQYRHEGFFLRHKCDSGK